MARMAWRRSLHLLQQQQRSLLPPLAAMSWSSPAAPLSAKKWHSKVNKGNADAEKKFQELQQAYELNKRTTDAEKKIEEILKAYEALKDDEKRALLAHIFGKRAARGAPGGFGRWILENDFAFYFLMSQAYLWCFIISK